MRKTWSNYRGPKVGLKDRQLLHRVTVVDVETGKPIPGFPRVYGSAAGPAQVEATHGTDPTVRIEYAHADVTWVPS